MNETQLQATKQNENANKITWNFASEVQDMADKIKGLSGLLAVLSITSKEAREFAVGSTLNTEFVASTFDMLWDVINDMQKQMESLANKAFQNISK